MNFFQALIVYILDPVLFLLFILIIAGVIMSWLVSFNVVNPRNALVGAIWRMTSAVTEPLLRPIRRILPPLGGLDFSPVVLLLLIGFIRAWAIPQLYMALG
ncbi:MAG: YggT family protein [Maricaulaceae bacterium]|nr:YggT family protein [Maricaulaceae bacterium]